ncbi:MAG: 50S ribosomal protein L6 [Bacteriovoracaceae bacterium]
MSRIGKKPINVPEKVQVSINGLAISVKGPNGNLNFVTSDKVKVVVDGKAINVSPADNSTAARSQWGTARTVISNMVSGVTTGFTKTLEFNGVGYRAAVTGSTLTLNLGFSHPIEHKLPQGVTAKVEKNTIILSGADKELVGFVAAQVRAYREPEPYKGKGVKYMEETIIRKAGKTGAKK